jgi:5-methylcytosine-specific restriction endonuclease McrA
MSYRAVQLKRTQRKRRYNIQHGKCYYCHRKMRPDPGDHHDLGATWDHKLPLSRGGANDPENRVLACCRCNRRKGDMTADEFFHLLAEAPCGVSVPLSSYLLHAG